MDFAFICEEFIQGFESLFPDNLRRTHGRYEQCVQYAFNRIEALDHVDRITIGRHTFLVSTENEMAFFTRCVRQECKFFSNFT